MDDPFDLIKDLKPKGRFAMRVFLQKYVIPVLEQKHQVLNEAKIIEIGEKEVAVFASRALIPNAFSAVDHRRITIGYFYEWIQAQNCRSIRYLDFSANDLLSTDAKLVAELVKRLTDDKLLSENGLIINHSYNRIHGIQTYQKEVNVSIKAILLNPQVKFVDLRVKPFESVDRMDFFQNTDNNECLKKLLWIQEIHLSSKNLQSVLPKGSKEKELIDEIQAVHKCDEGKYQILFEIN